MRQTLRIAISLSLFGCILLVTQPAGAVVQLQGYYDAWARTQAFDKTWQFDQPNHYLELRVLATPWKDWEAFGEISANSGRFLQTKPWELGEESDNIDIHRPEFLFNEAHILFRRPFLEAVAFSHQNRFWFSQPLLNIVDGNTLTDNWDGPRSQAIRFDLRNIKGFGGVFYWGAKSTNQEDFLAGRFFKGFAQNRMLLGLTFGRRHFGQFSNDYDETAALDFEIALGEIIPGISRLGRVTLVAEAGRNFSGGGALDDEEDKRNGVQAELRDFRLGRITFKSNVWSREPDFYTSISGREGDDDRKGYFVEAWWQVPHKQMDLRLAYKQNRAFEQVEADGELFHQDELWAELYMELKGNFGSWIKYRRFSGNTNITTGDSVYPNLVFELQGQNKLISVRPQVRFRDFGTRFAVQGFGMDLNLNVTSKWKFFGRILNANENTESRQTIFLQARYAAWNNAEFYLEYGDGGRSDRLTENDGFVGEGPSAMDQDFDRRIQLILRLWF